MENKFIYAIPSSLREYGCETAALPHQSTRARESRRRQSVLLDTRKYERGRSGRPRKTERGSRLRRKASRISQSGFLFLVTGVSLGRRGFEAPTRACSLKCDKPYVGTKYGYGVRAAPHAWRSLLP